MMAQKQRITQLPLLGALLLGLLVSVYLITWRRNMKADDKTTKHKVETSSDETLSYWTADKMRGAQPAPMPTTNPVERKKKRPHRRPENTDPHLP